MNLTDEQKALLEVLRDPPDDVLFYATARLDAARDGVAPNVINHVDECALTEMRENMLAIADAMLFRAQLALNPND